MKGKEKSLKAWEQDLKKREQHLSDNVKQLASVRSKVVQQEHVINELENSKKLLETEISLSKKVGGESRHIEMNGDTGAGGSSRADLNAGLIEMKLSMLEHRVQLVETENLRLRQDALRSEQLRLSEMQINLERRQSQLLANSMMDSANYMNQRNSQWQSVMQNGQFSSGNMGVRQQAYPGQIPMQQNLWTNQVLGYAPHPHSL